MSSQACWLHGSHMDPNCTVCALGKWPFPKDKAAMVLPDVPNNDEVICPRCFHGFRAIPVNVQTLLLAAGYEPPFLLVPVKENANAPDPQS